MADGTSDLANRHRAWHPFRAMPDAAIHAAGPIVEQLGEVLYSAELPNGKRVLAHLSKPLAQAGAKFAAGQRVVMELTPYDFDQARIIRPADGSDG